MTEEKKHEKARSRRCLMFAAHRSRVAQEKKDAKKEPTAAQKAQQERMKSCNEQAGAKKMKATRARNS